MALYLPSDLPYNSCVVVLDNYTARVYEEIPNENSFNDYIDVALDNHYLYRYGTDIFTTIEEVPSCLPSSEISHAWFDRTDLSDILLCIFILLFILWFCLSKPIKWLFRGWF